MEGNGTIVADIDNNTIPDNGTSSFDYGIRGGARGGNGTADLTVNNNVAFGEAAGVWFFSGNATAGETSRLTLNLVSNNVDGGPTSFADYFVEQYTNTTFQLQGFAGTGTNAASSQPLLRAGMTMPAPWSNAGSGTTVNYPSGTAAAPLLAADGEGPGGASLTADALAPILGRKPSLAGATPASPPSRRHGLDGVAVAIADLADGVLASTWGTDIIVDDDAAGWGWFVDATPIR